jgi:predicted aconitase with swiveling domain
MIPRSITARDRGLALISRVNRWLITGAVGISGLISIAAAHAFHGRTLGGSTAVIQRSRGSTHGAGSGLQQPAGAPVASPAPAPPAASAPAPVVSGSS